MERQFHTHFRAKPKMCIAQLSRVTQRNGETADFFYLSIQDDEKQMQDPYSKDEVCENGPKRFGH